MIHGLIAALVALITVAMIALLVSSLVHFTRHVFATARAHGSSRLAAGVEALVSLVVAAVVLAFFLGPALFLLWPVHPVCGPL